MTNMQEPDSRFVDRLEWQLASEYRRASRSKSAGKIAVPRRLLSIAVMAGVLMTGVAALKAADYIRESWRKKIEVARMETEIRLKQVCFESAKEMAARSAALAARGLIREAESLAVNAGARKAGLECDRAKLNLDEVKASGLAPRDEIYAPLVSGRDFVGARLEIARREIELDLELLEGRLVRLRQLAAEALVGRDELEQARADLDARKGAIEEIRKRLELRKRFVAGGIPAEKAEIEDRISAAENKLNLTQARIDVLKEKTKRYDALEAKGMVSGAEAREFRDALDAAQAEMRFTALERDVLEKMR